MGRGSQRLFNGPEAGDRCPRSNSDTASCLTRLRSVPSAAPEVGSCAPISYEVRCWLGKVQRLAHSHTAGGWQSHVQLRFPGSDGGAKSKWHLAKKGHGGVCRGPSRHRRGVWTWCRGHWGATDGF